MAFTRWRIRAEYCVGGDLRALHSRQSHLYNGLNANTATVIDPRSGARFLRPVNILPPRIAELSATYTF